jgi:hypothetical protein
MVLKIETGAISAYNIIKWEKLTKNTQPTKS